MVNYVEYLKIAGAVILPSTYPFIQATSKKNQESLKEWYSKLNFPSYKPPGFIFAPVWTALYSAMGYSSYLIYKNGGGFSGPAKIPLILYGSQLAMNWAWSPIFFEQRKIGLAAIEMTGLLGLASATTYAFYKQVPLAGYLLLPYLAWLAFALNLNFQIWRLNRPAIKNDF